MGQKSIGHLVLPRACHGPSASAPTNLGPAHTASTPTRLGPVGYGSDSDSGLFGTGFNFFMHYYTFKAVIEINSAINLVPEPVPGPNPGSGAGSNKSGTGPLLLRLRVGSNNIGPSQAAPGSVPTELGPGLRLWSQSRQNWDWDRDMLYFDMLFFLLYLFNTAVKGFALWPPQLKPNNLPILTHYKVVPYDIA
jgi:hypothetical protein